MEQKQKGQVGKGTGGYAGCLLEQGVFHSWQVDDTYGIHERIIDPRQETFRRNTQGP